MSLHLDSVAALLCCIILTAFAKTSQAQVASPLAEGLGLATVARDDAWGAHENPATAPLSAGISASAYGLSPLQLSQLRRYGLDVGYVRGTTFATISVQQFTPPGYRSGALQLGAGRQLAEGLHVGIRVGLAYADYEEYGSRLEPIAQAGVRYQVSGGLFAGAHYQYVENSLLPLAEHRLKIGVDYASSPKVHVSVAGWQSIGHRLAGGVGLSYNASERLGFRLGARSEGAAVSFGAHAQLASGFGVSLTALVYSQLPTAAAYGISYLPTNP